MREIFSTIGFAVFVAMIVTCWRYIRWRDKFSWVAFWSCAVVIALMLAIGERLGITVKKVPAAPVTVDARKLADVFHDTEFELMKYDEVVHVQFLTNDEAGELIIRLIVNDLVT